MLITRPAGDADFVVVARLLEELGRDALTPEHEPVFRERYWRHLRRPDVGTLVAEFDGIVVGVLVLEFRERLSRPGREAWFPDLVAAGSARGQGIGKALLLRAFALSREAGCYQLTLETGYQREVAQALYRSVGMTDRGLYMDIDLTRLEHSLLEPMASTPATAEQLNAKTRVDQTGGAQSRLDPLRLEPSNLDPSNLDP